MNELKTRHARHFLVGQNQIKRLVAKASQGLFAAFCQDRFEAPLFEETSCQFELGGLVVHHENSKRICHLTLRAGKRNGDAKTAPLPNLALDINLSSMGLYNPARNSQAQSRAVVLRGKVGFEDTVE